MNIFYGSLSILRGLPIWEPESHFLNASDSSSISKILPDLRAGNAFRSMALLSVVRCTPHALLISAMVFMWYSFQAKKGGGLLAFLLDFPLRLESRLQGRFPCRDAACESPLLCWMRSGLENLDEVGFLVPPVPPIIGVPRGRSFLCGCGHLCDLLYLVVKFCCTSLGTFLLYSTTVEMSSVFGMNIQHAQKLIILLVQGGETV